MKLLLQPDVIDVLALVAVWFAAGLATGLTAGYGVTRALIRAYRRWESLKRSWARYDRSMENRRSNV